MNTKLSPAETVWANRLTTTLTELERVKAERDNAVDGYKDDRSKLHVALKAVSESRDELLGALKETTDALYNETAGKYDTPWIASVKVKAVNTYANCKPAQSAISKAEGK